MLRRKREFQAGPTISCRREMTRLVMAGLARAAARGGLIGKTGHLIAPQMAEPPLSPDDKVEDYKRPNEIKF